MQSFFGIRTGRAVASAIAVAAVALGATPLKPEKSTNFSGGFTITPFKGWPKVAG